jgi:hypothetical protein
VCIYRTMYDCAVEWYLDMAHAEMSATGSAAGASFPVQLWHRVEVSSGSRSVELRSTVTHGRSSTVGVTSLSVDGVCDACGSERASFRCSGCRMARYCSRECQVAHWPVHRDSCLPRRPNDLRDILQR